MAVHRFAIDVPNPSAHPEVVELQIKPVSTLKGSELPEGKLSVERAGLALDPCDTDLDKTLHVKLPPFASVTVAAVVVTAPKGKGAAFFHVADVRNKKAAGGVTIVCIEPKPKDPPGQTVPAVKPCEVAIAGKPYVVPPESDPSKATGAALLTLGAECDFVVPLTNRLTKPIDNVVAYLEHLGGSDAACVPTTWNVGKMAPGQIFYATWRLKGTGGKTGPFEASIVVESSKKDPTRLRAPFRVVQKG